MDIEDAIELKIEGDYLVCTIPIFVCVKDFYK